MRVLKERRTECIVLLCYVIGVVCIGIFHEPWFDEGQAWQIARSASIREILFEVPHYEGHPPLWHLLLAIFAKNHMPYELSLHVINITFCTIAVALLVFKSPFPKIIRCALPFTYYFFYQYGVISRPYSLMMIAIMLTAMTYKNRNEKSWSYILSLCLLCLTSAYGILISGGLCIVWVIEILEEMLKNGTLKTFWKDRRFYSLCFILILAILLYLMIRPAEDCYYGDVDEGVTVFTNLANLVRWLWWFFYQFDAWFGQYFTYTTDKTDIVSIAAETLGGVIFWLILIPILKKNKRLKLFLIPHCLMTCFMVFFYFSVHHSGILILFDVFVFWTIFEQPEGLQIPEKFKELWKKFDSEKPRKLCRGFAVFAGIVPLIYTTMASYYEITENYGQIMPAKFIKEHHLEDKKIMLAWDWKFADKQDESSMWDTHYMPSKHPEMEKHYTYLIGHGALLLPYFDENIFMNFNADCPEDLYMHFKYKEDTEKIFALWRQQGLPDFIVSYCPIEEVYGEEMLKDTEYLCIYEYNAGWIFKGVLTSRTYRIFIRDDLLPEYPQFERMYP
ncbi:MAG: hypothetical protein K2H29_12575 [Oscillospiraceae bacterium]|nr:hypothetical protein [Oscillospiraceae bacterium]